MLWILKIKQFCYLFELEIKQIKHININKKDIKLMDINNLNRVKIF